ncbi:MAG TPA: glycoside hydrolase family 88 protein [Planctomycetota bacterium]|nr:glycoside hydrolase family 88 protein [Planctomycetota bacterium]
MTHPVHKKSHTTRHCILAGLLTASVAWAAEEGGQDLFQPDAIVRLMHRANDWQSAHPVMRETDRNWERGTWYTGVMAAQKATGDERLLAQALAWGRLHQWQVGTERGGANRLFCVQTWLELYFLKRDEAMIRSAIAWLGTNAPNSPAGAERWYLGGGRSYADSLYGAAALAMLAKATGDRKHLETMHRFFWDVTGELLDKAENLYYRDRRFIGQKSPGGKKVLWSRGNGWVFAGLARVLECLPEDDPQRPRYVELFKSMAAALVVCQAADGLWRPNLADPQQIAAPESSGTGFFCYGLAWGIRHKLLAEDRYAQAVARAWRGLTACVSPEGKVQWGQRVGDRPADVTEKDSHEYVTGTFLLAASEVLHLVREGRLPAVGEASVAGDRMDLAAVRRQVMAYCESLQVKDRPYGVVRERAAPNALGTLYATCDVAWTRACMGEDLARTLTPAQRQQWIDHINSFARGDGTYPGGRHSAQHANGMVIGALAVLGGRQKHPVSLYDEFDDDAEIEPWLEKIHWERQWSASHLFWGGMHCYSLSRRCRPAWRERVFQWLDANLDPQTGWWRKGVPQAGQRIEVLGGAAHIWPIYQHHGRRFPYPKQVIDSILAMQRPDGSWLGFGNYMELDALYGLAYMRSLAPEHRAADIAAAAQRHGRLVRERFAGFLAATPDAHLLLAVVGTLALLQELDPEHFRDEVRWSDIFSDRSFYRTDLVECGPPPE